MAQCSVPGCFNPVPVVTRRGRGRKRTRCDVHRSNHDKIKGYRWDRVRAEVLKAEPLCRGCGAVATTADHIIPLEMGGDPYARSNLQPLCRRCNDRKGLGPNIYPPYPWRGPQAAAGGQDEAVDDGHRPGLAWFAFLDRDEDEEAEVL